VILEDKQVLCRKRYERWMINDPWARLMAPILRENGGKKTASKQCRLEK
jgi:hypothetical protein